MKRDDFKHFLACQVQDIYRALSVNLPRAGFLLAVNETGPTTVLNAVDEGLSVLVDSGVFSLTNAHARAHRMSMDEVLALPPPELDGFEQAKADYISLMSQVGDKVYGYIELDLGGREWKTKLRGEFEELGLNPMPVLHPLLDGWDYLDELLDAGYERIAVGNIVHLPRSFRLRLLGMLYEKTYDKDVQIHLLGMSPDVMCHAYPQTSCDSVSWKKFVIWRQVVSVKCDLAPFADMKEDFYGWESREEGGPLNHSPGVSARAYEYLLQDLSTAHRRKRLRELGIDS